MTSPSTEKLAESVVQRDILEKPDAVLAPEMLSHASLGTNIYTTNTEISGTGTYKLNTIPQSNSSIRKNFMQIVGEMGHDPVKGLLDIHHELDIVARECLSNGEKSLWLKIKQTQLGVEKHIIEYGFSKAAIVTKHQDTRVQVDPVAIFEKLTQRTTKESENTVKRAGSILTKFADADYDPDNPPVIDLTAETADMEDD